jgi:hypothetical protein
MQHERIKIIENAAHILTFLYEVQNVAFIFFNTFISNQNYF